MAVEFDLHLPLCGSLKDKRSQLQPILHGLRRRFLAAASEVGHADLHHRALVGMAVVGPSPSQLEKVVESAQEWIWSQGEVEIISASVAWCDSDD